MNISNEKKVVVVLAISSILVGMRVTAAAGTRWDFSAAPSSDDQHLAFYSYRGESNPDIYVVDLSSGTERNLTSSPNRWDIEPDWSPDSDRIAFSSGPDMEQMDIHVIRSDGSGERRIIHGPNSYLGPDWSPDGSRLAFSVAEEQPWAINLFVSDADGENPILLTEAFPNSTENPDWSPDGRSIVFSSRPDLETQSDLYRVEVATGKTVQLTDTETSERFPSWSPDGRTVYFSTGEGGKNSHIRALPWDADRAGVGAARAVTGSGDQEQYFVTFSHKKGAMYYSSGSWEDTFWIYRVPLHGHGESDHKQVTGLDHSLP